MQRVVWGPMMETGDELVDEQHRGLVELFNGLLDAQSRQDDQSVSAVLERLCDYVIVHFSAEEALMQRVGYPEQSVSAHRTEHEALTERTRGMVLQFRSGELESIVPLVEFLSNWLSEHIAECDQRMVEFARAQNGAS